MRPSPYGTLSMRRPNRAHAFINICNKAVLSSLNSALYKSLSKNHVCLRYGQCKWTGTCTYGARSTTYNVLAGSVLSVWNKVEAIMSKNSNKKMQVLGQLFHIVLIA